MKQIDEVIDAHGGQPIKQLVRECFKMSNNNDSSESKAYSHLQQSYDYYITIYEYDPSGSLIKKNFRCRILTNHPLQIQSNSYERYVALTGSAHCDIANPVIVFCYSSIIEKSYGHLKAYLNHYTEQQIKALGGIDRQHALRYSESRYFFCSGFIIQKPYGHLKAYLNHYTEQQIKSLCGINRYLALPHS